MGQFGGPGFSQWCKEAIPRLVQVIQAPDAREQENLNPTENAISAVTKILKWNHSSINVDEVLPLWYDKIRLTLYRLFSTYPQLLRSSKSS